MRPIKDYSKMGIFFTLNFSHHFLFNHEDRNPQKGGILMTNEQKQKIAELRSMGVSYSS